MVQAVLVKGVRGIWLLATAMAGGCGNASEDTEVAGTGSSGGALEPMGLTLSPTRTGTTTDGSDGTSSDTRGGDDTGDDAETGAVDSFGSGTTGAAVCELELDFPEFTQDSICIPETSTEQRLLACLCEYSPALMDAAERPLDATDLLYYVNRFYSIDPCFPFDPDPTVLAEVRADYINQVGDLEPELETRCGTYDDDLVAVPLGLTNDDDQLRAVAWLSDAPADYSTTQDGLDVGYGGSVGFGAMFAAAWAEAGIELYVRSGFRSMETQAALFEYYAGLEGDPAIAATYSAWPSHSEHQLGTTADVGYIEDGVMISPFAPLEADLHWTEAFVWIRANAHRFGIVTTYQPTKVHLHQYKPEPWHLRFVGVEAADLMHACGLSTEELLAYRYRRGALPDYAELDLVYDAQVDGGWNPETCEE